VELSWLELGSFRCYNELHFEPAPGVNVLVGNNGAGKTSVLEAVGYLGLLRSFRGIGDEALVATGADAMVVRGEFSISSRTVRVEAEIPRAGRRTILLNGKRPQRNRDVLAQVPIVVFQPDDLSLVKGGPSLRRRYLDDLAAQLWPQAAVDQQDYDKTLRQRNTLLRQKGRAADREALDAWDDRIATSGAKVFLHRARVLEDLDAHLPEAYRMVGASGSLTWDYRSNWQGILEEDETAAHIRLATALAARRERDFDQRLTTGGPHRDDPALIISDRAARTMASQGEQRTAALALRVAAYRVLAQQRSLLPILLLDDVFSELDPLRSKGVLGLLLDGGQVLVTTARDDEVPLDGRRWMVQGGAVT
jgi:DNA replication and repair protein RecF